VFTQQMTILDVVARGAFEKSEKSALSGRAHDTNQTKPRTSHGTIALASVVGGSLVIGATAAALAFRKRDEIATKFRKAMIRFLSHDETPVATPLMDALETRLARMEAGDQPNQEATNKDLLDQMLVRIGSLEETMQQLAADLQGANNLVELLNTAIASSDEAITDARNAQELAVETADAPWTQAHEDPAMADQEKGREKFIDISDRLGALSTELENAVLVANSAVTANHRLAAESAAATEAALDATDKVDKATQLMDEFKKTFANATKSHRREAADLQAEIAALQTTVTELGTTVTALVTTVAAGYGPRLQPATLVSQSAQEVGVRGNGAKLKAATPPSKPPGKAPSPELAKTPKPKWHNFGGRPYV
jgi:hypothetical protein